jgi:hypothetical protein
MPIQATADGGLEIFDASTCPECEETGTLSDTGCDAPGCRGWQCIECGWGCDVDTNPDGGRCAAAQAAESDEDHTARVNGERAAFGLSPLA